MRQALNCKQIEWVYCIFFHVFHGISRAPNCFFVRPFFSNSPRSLRLRVHKSGVARALWHFSSKILSFFLATDGVATDGVSVSNFEILGDNGYCPFQFAMLWHCRPFLSWRFWVKMGTIRSWFWKSKLNFWFIGGMIRNSLKNRKHTKLERTNCHLINRKRKTTGDKYSEECHVFEICSTVRSYPSSTLNPYCPPHSWPPLENASCVPSLSSTTWQPSCSASCQWLGLGWRRNCVCCFVFLTRGSCLHSWTISARMVLSLVCYVTTQLAI